MSEAVHQSEQTDKRLRRFAEISGLEIADPLQRMQAIVSLDGFQLVDLLAVGAGILRGEARFSRLDDIFGTHNVVSSPIMGEELEPPDDSHGHFIRFFERLKKRIYNDPGNIDKYAVELYFGIIGSHMFPDGNGRLARTVFYLVKTGQLPSEEFIFNRTEGVLEASRLNNQEATKRLLDKEKLPYKAINDFEAREDYDPEVGPFQSGGLTLVLKYIAAKRVHGARGTWNPDRIPTLIGLKNWSDAELEEFKVAYRTVREEWLEEYMQSASEFSEFFNQRLSN